MPKEITTYLCCMCSKSFIDREACNQHEQSHEHTDNVQLHYMQDKVYPYSVTLHFERDSIKYYALEEGMPQYHPALSVKTKL